MAAVPAQCEGSEVKNGSQLVNSDVPSSVPPTLLI